MEIREYRTYNEGEILHLYASVSWTAYTDYPEALRKGFENSMLTLAAYNDDQLLGIIRAVGDGYTIVFVQDILVAPEYQRKGIGTALLRAILDRYSHVRQIELSTDNNQYPNYTIIPYDEKYRDDMIFMVLEAKDALGRIPRLNEDLLDVKRNYLDTGDMFWLAIDKNDRVIGCIGYNSIPGTTEVKLHRLYVKAARKRQGIGTRLLRTVELHLQEQGKTAAHVHLGGKEYFESRSFYPKHGYKEYALSMMKKEL